MRRLPHWSAFLVLSFATSSIVFARADGDEAAEQVPSFNRDIRPLLSDRCFHCHGTDANTRAADLRLDSFEAATADRGGFAAIVPGDPDSSELLYRAAHEEDDLAMPPADSNKARFTERELQLLRRWIQAGAEYEEHWAFVAPTKPPVPEFEHDAWCTNEIDRFLLRELDRVGVAPADPADRATLLRRVFLDLTGLPPTLEELDRFLADDRPDAFERQVDVLLTEEPYKTRLAEHFATPWLDAARYADTIGIHTDNGRQLWPWRDWVLAAFRDNLPYDRFLTEQLAGDLLPDATTSSRVATGFQRSHVITDEGGAIDEEYLVEYAVDRTNTTGAVYLGLTVGCARCHDHKFDPLTQEDYYELYTFFRSNDEPGLYSQSGDVNRAFEPFIEVPSDEQVAELAEYAKRIEEAEAALAQPLNGEAERRTSFENELATRAGVAWSRTAFVDAASSEEGVEFRALADGSVLVEGPVPTIEDHVFRYTTGAVDARLLLIEALVPEGHTGPGRVAHGNAVMSELVLETRALGSRSAWREVPMRWAWTDHTQPSGKFEATNVLFGEDQLGWALDSHGSSPDRTLIVLTDEPFGAAGGTELRVTFVYRSIYPQHSLGRVRLSVSPLVDESVLPVAGGTWFKAGPFEATSKAEAYDGEHRPSDAEFLRVAHGDDRWRLYENFVDGQRKVFGETGIASNYVGRVLWSPDERDLELSLGSDDGIRVFVNGEAVFEKRVDRGVAEDQDRATVHLFPGPNQLVIEAINTGGAGGVYFQALEGDDVLVGELPSMLFPESATPENQRADQDLAWRRRFFEDWRELDDARLALVAERDELQASVPRTMVLKELAEPRMSYVLDRGQYDHPRTDAPLSADTPSFLPAFDDDAPKNRLGLASWMTSAENPLVSRVAVNRFWMQVFGKGLVRTPSDFGFQGQWPTHPELLDWLAVDFRESGWDVHRLLKKLVLSSTYRQSSRVRAELADMDPDNRLMARYPRRRMGAEGIRDNALFVSGLLVERFGGPPVKPQQPDGLWREVSMLQSNTRTFEASQGEDLWRRSVYTYWKRAVPPPNLQTFDAPTRESCVISRESTNTPLQALTLLNDVQFVEAANALGARGLALDEPDDRARTRTMFRMVTGRAPESDELAALERTLGELRSSFEADPEQASALLAYGSETMAMPESTLETHSPVERAAWSLLANAMLNLHETVTID